MTVDNITSTLSSTSCSLPTTYLHVGGDKKLKQVLALRHKIRLYRIIVTKDSKPDHSCINLYWDKFCSWYISKKIYAKGYKTKYITKSKTAVIHFSYAELAKDYYYSQQTIRARIFRLERLRLINGSSKYSAKTINQLVIYVWQDTLYFINRYGINRKKALLKFPTSCKYTSPDLRKDNLSEGRI